MALILTGNSSSLTIDSNSGINSASITGVITLSGSTSGAITLQANAVAGTNTLTLPNNTGVLLSNASTFGGTGPAFSAYPAGAQSVSANAWTKVVFDTKEFDTANCYSTANSRFTPTVAGYYQLIATAYISGGASFMSTSFYKNGTIFKQCNQVTSAVQGLNNTIILYLNGSTDYVEFYVYLISSLSLNSGNSTMYFQGCLIRGA